MRTVIVLMDSLNRRAMECYGGQWAATPDFNRFPMVLNNDEAVVKACTLTSWRATPAETRLCVIRNTLELNEILLSQPLLDDIAGQEGVEVLSPPFPLAFDDDGVLLSRI